MNKIPVFNCKFKVHIDEVTDENDTFTSIDGLSKYISSYKNQSFGGDSYTNCFVENFSTKNLILKRPLMKRKSGITKWCEKCLDDLNFSQKDMMIFVLNIEEEIVASWTVLGVIPFGIDISTIQLNSSNTILEQSITIRYRDLKMELS
jgi:phage tail-like protein